MKPHRTITFQPDPDVKTLLAKAVRRLAQATGREHGHASRIVNEAVRGHLAYLCGKREKTKFTSQKLDRAYAAEAGKPSPVHVRD